LSIVSPSYTFFSSVRRYRWDGVGGIVERSLVSGSGQNASTITLSIAAIGYFDAGRSTGPQAPTKMSSESLWWMAREIGVPVGSASATGGGVIGRSIETTLTYFGSKTILPFRC
jgi:hypothetical protein